VTFPYFIAQFLQHAGARCWAVEAEDRRFYDSRIVLCGKPSWRRKNGEILSSSRKRSHRGPASAYPDAARLTLISNGGTLACVEPITAQSFCLLGIVRPASRLSGTKHSFRALYLHNICIPRDKIRIDAHPFRSLRGVGAAFLLCAGQSLAVRHRVLSENGSQLRSPFALRAFIQSLFADAIIGSRILDSMRQVGIYTGKILEGAKPLICRSCSRPNSSSSSTCKPRGRSHRCASDVTHTRRQGHRIKLAAAFGT
jgi:hypothetical protein